MKTVLVTQEAKDAALRMKSIVHGGLSQQVQDLQRRVDGVLDEIFAAGN